MYSWISNYEITSDGNGNIEILNYTVNDDKNHASPPPSSLAKSFWSAPLRNLCLAKMPLAPTPHNRINSIVNRILSMLQPTTKSQALSEADFSGIASSTSTARLSLSPIRRCPNFCSSKAFQIMTDFSSHTFYEGDWIVQRGKSVCLKNSLSSQTKIVCIRCMYSLVWT